MNPTRKRDCVVIGLRQHGTITKPLDRYKILLNRAFGHLRRLVFLTGSSLVVCLVLQAAINILLATLNRKDGHGGEEGGETTKKKKKKEGVLLRPIICICNDL